MHGWDGHPVTEFEVEPPRGFYWWNVPDTRKLKFWLAKSFLNVFSQNGLYTFVTSHILFVIGTWSPQFLTSSWSLSVPWLLLSLSFILMVTLMVRHHGTCPSSLGSVCHTTTLRSPTWCRAMTFLLLWVFVMMLGLKWVCFTVMDSIPLCRRKLWLLQLDSDHSQIVLTNNFQYFTC